MFDDEKVKHMHKALPQVCPLPTRIHTQYLCWEWCSGIDIAALSLGCSFRLPLRESLDGFMMEENVRRTTEWRFPSRVPTWLDLTLKTASWSHITCVHASLTGSDCKETPTHSHVRRLTTQRDSTQKMTNWSHITETLTKRKVSPSCSHTHMMRTYKTGKRAVSQHFISWSVITSILPWRSAMWGKCVFKKFL